MAMVQPKSQKLRLLTTHLLLLVFIAAIMFPPLMVIAISLREGNFATGSLIPDQISWEHWRLALGFSVEHADGRVTRHLPGSAVVVELGESGRDHRHRYRGAVHDLRLCLRPYALPGQSDPAERDVDFPDVPGGAVAGGVIRLV